MSWGLFIGGIMAGFAVAGYIFEKVKMETAEPEAPVRETKVLEAYEPAPCMTAEEFDAGMDRLFAIFAME